MGVIAVFTHGVWPLSVPAADVKVINAFFYYGLLQPNYWHLVVIVSRDVPFAGALNVAMRQSECGSKDR